MTATLRRSRRCSTFAFAFRLRKIITQDSSKLTVAMLSPKLSLSTWAADTLIPNVFVDDDLIGTLWQKPFRKETLSQYVRPVGKRAKLHRRIDMTGLVIIPPPMTACGKSR